ncbi:MAG: BrnT family toxin [Sterolibacterium sp.]
MDIEFELRGIVFRWDAEKEQTNIHKHDGVTFRQAAQVFFDPFLMGVDASRNDELREGALGADFDMHVLYVVHVFFEDDHIRIISARKADPSERKSYEDGND